MNLEENEYKDNFTKEGDKTNLNINKLEVDCITSNQNNFSIDEEGNLKVNSISLNNTNTDIDLIYPIGSIYMNVSNVNPNTLFGGTWERIEDRFLLASGNNYQNGTTGGEKEHRHDFKIGLPFDYMEVVADSLEKSGAYSYSEQKYSKEFNFDEKTIENSNANSSHQLSCIEKNGRLSSSIGDTQIASSLPPYLAVNIWKRIG